MSLFDATFGQGSHEAQPPEVEGVYWVPFRVPWIPGGCELRCGGPPREDDDERGLKLTLFFSLSRRIHSISEIRELCTICTPRALGQKYPKRENYFSILLNYAIRLVNL